MRVTRLTTGDELAAIGPAGDALARGVPFLTNDWLAAWWGNYGRGGTLYVLAVHDVDGRLVALAPWHLVRSSWQGRMLRFLGSGEVCSDYQTVMCRPGCESEVAAALAEALCRRPSLDGSGSRWDLIDLMAVPGDDPLLPNLAEELSARGCAVHRQPGPNCWRLDLPATWDAYLTTLSKSHRKQVRRVETRLLDTGRAVLHTVSDERQLQQGFDILVDLHQRRRQSLGDPGCFASPRFTAFHGEVMHGLLRSGRLRLHWLELDGRPVAAEYHLAGDGIVYAYQSGVDPDLLDEEPGRIAAVATLRQAIGDGCRAIDFLRGDEPYKAHWRAQPRPTIDYRIAAPRPIARLRNEWWLAARAVKRRIAAIKRAGGVIPPDDVEPSDSHMPVAPAPEPSPTVEIPASV
jgi:CelD/BcsL family acetyltransferase involved in cellulose biosynthesis